MLHDFGGNLHHLVDLDLLPDDPIVVDAGACIGGFIVAIRDLRPKAKIFAIEPCRRNLEDLRVMVAVLPRVELVEAALAGTSGTLLLTDPIGENGRYYQWPSVYLTNAARAFSRSDFVEAKIYNVPAVTLADVVGDAHIDYLKMDIEGAEADVLDAGLDPDQIGQLSMEVHGPIPLEQRLRDLGFAGIEVRGSEVYARGRA